MNNPYRDADLFLVTRSRRESPRRKSSEASRVGTAWYFCAMSALFVAFPITLVYQSAARPWVLPLCLLILPLGFAAGWFGVSFHRWAMRVGR